MEFDYVIVGGGSAGSVLANRLSARAGDQVLLIEAGMDTPPGQVPADILEMFPKAALNPAYKWMKLARLHAIAAAQLSPPADAGALRPGQGHGRRVEHQLPGRQSRRARGLRRMGGSSARPAGAGRTCCPISRSSRTMRDFGGSELHGKGGPLPVQRMRREEWCGYTRAVAQALESAQLRYLDDQNGRVRRRLFRGDAEQSRRTARVGRHRLSRRRGPAPAQSAHPGAKPCAGAALRRPQGHRRDGCRRRTASRPSRPGRSSSRPARCIRRPC